jgi:TM2 domain-containing membrane protein YozV
MAPKNKVTAAVLAFFTGFIGGHKLYLGSIGGFIGLMILFTISLMVNFPISLIVGLIQGIKLINMPEQEFDRRYNKGIIQVKSGPLEARRDAQMRRFDQVPERQNRPGKSANIEERTIAARANPYKNSGIKKYKDFDLEDAITDFKKGLELAPNDVALHFNLACAYSLTEKKALAYHHVSKAVALGLKDVERIQSHDDLAYVRIQPEYDAFRASGFRTNPFELKPQKSAADAPSSQTVEMDADIDESLLVQLNKLSELRKKGILSEDEFNFERKKILKQ